jgi:hypothetical protein
MKFEQREATIFQNYYDMTKTWLLDSLFSGQLQQVQQNENSPILDHTKYE